MPRFMSLVLALVGSLLLGVQSAAAAPVHQPGTYFEFLGWASQITSRTEIDLSVFIHNSRGVNQVEVRRVTYALNGPQPRLVSEEFGTGYLDASQLTVDGLASVVTTPIGIELFDCDARGCRSTGVEQVSMSLTGVGPVTTTIERGAYRLDGCNYRFADTYRSGDAASSLSFGDLTLSGEGTLLTVDYSSYVAGCDAA